MAKRKFKCTGCGVDRPCFIETNQESSGFEDMVIDDLVCILDATNQTSYNWKEVNTCNHNHIKSSDGLDECMDCGERNY